MKKTLIALSIASISMIACSKNDDTTPPPNVAGFWTGVSGENENKMNNSMSALLRNDGTLRLYFGNPDTALAIKANGTYTTSLPGNVKGTYKFNDNSQESFEALLTADFLEMSGSTGQGATTTGISGFELIKEQ